MVTLNLSAMVRSKINQNGYRVLRGSQVTKSLVMLPLGELGDGFTLNDDLANRCVDDEIHLEVRLQRLAHEEGMKLLLLGERQAFGRERLGQSLLVDILGKAGPKLAIDIMQTANDIVSGLDQLLPFGFLDGAEALRLLREERLDICGFHKLVF